MKSQSKKSTQIFLGILSGIAIWIIGLLMSGRLAFVEELELYPTGKLILAFPLVLAFICIMIARYSARAGKRVYYISSMVSLLFPLLTILISTMLGSVSEWEIPVISDVAEFLITFFMLPLMFFMLPYYPMFSIFSQIIDATNTNIFLMSGSILIALVGVIASVLIFKKEE